MQRSQHSCWIPLHSGERRSIHHAAERNDNIATTPSLTCFPRPRLVPPCLLSVLLLRSCCSNRVLQADTERKHSENTTLAAQQAVTKLMTLITSEGESALSNLRSSHPTVSSPPSALTSGSPHAHSSMLHGHAASAAHPSHLSRRVSFNRDVLMVVSPEIGALHDGSNGGGSSSSGPSVARVDEESDDGAKTAAGPGAGVSSAAFQRERRLSRTEFNEGEWRCGRVLLRSFAILAC